MGDAAGCVRHFLVRGVCMDFRSMTAPQTVVDVLDAAYAKVIAKIAMDAHAIGWQAGVGGS